MSSILGLLTEYGVWPRVTNASALTDSIKVQILHLLIFQAFWQICVLLTTFNLLHLSD